MAAAGLGALHIIMEFFLLPLPRHAASPAFLAMVVTGAAALIFWRYWQPPVQRQG